MNVMNDIAEARASALSLRASAKACTSEQGPLRFRLARAADALDAVVLIAVRGIERIEQLEQELRKVHVRTLTSVEESDFGDALRAVHQRLGHARACVADGMRAVDRLDHAIINIVLVLLDQGVAAELTDARLRGDGKRELASSDTGKQVARLRARLGVAQVAS